MGRPGRPGLGRPPGLAEFPSPRPSLGLGFASASAVVMLPGPSTAYVPFLHCTARWARARPLLCSASQSSGGDGVGAGSESGGGAAGHAALDMARKGYAEMQKLAPPLSWESRAQLRVVVGATPSPAAFTRPLKFSATVRAALTPEALQA
ncbi:hypothetical protein mRhiFer1_008171 [Rhinolophus ferrumequinum]|uniref:Uncharacterized protein n=1 Tax=Rhinolophus ferrumequinum TaxID=59479 RepID=A0A7J7W7Z3_RHIFE|nr:hypothetical protein mRhiFer1_008171 [Rhinolophus ferrumequinum]